MRRGSTACGFARVQGRLTYIPLSGMVRTSRLQATCLVKAETCSGRPPLIIISRRLYRALISMGAKGFSVEPVHFVD